MSYELDNNDAFEFVSSSEKLIELFSKYDKLIIALENAVSIFNNVDHYSIEELKQYVDMCEITSKESLIESIKSGIRKAIDFILKMIETIKNAIVNTFGSWKKKVFDKDYDKIKDINIPADKKEEFNKLVKGSSSSTEAMNRPINPNDLDRLNSTLDHFGISIFDSNNNIIFISSVISEFEGCVAGSILMLRCIADDKVDQIDNNIEELAKKYPPVKYGDPVEAGWGDSKQLKKVLDTIIGMKGTLNNLKSQCDTLLNQHQDWSEDRVKCLKKIKTLMHNFHRASSAIYIVCKRAHSAKVKLCQI